MQVSTRLVSMAVAVLALAALPALAQAPATPPAAAPASPPAPTFATTKVTDNVYIFRYVGHQAMFIVTKDGVIATDPISYQRPQAAQAYIAEIRKITDKPIKYLIYSHHHYDHAAGGKAFKDAGAQILAHKNAKAHLAKLKPAETLVPDIGVGDRHVINLGGVRLELLHVGRNHSDNSLVMYLPKEKIIFAVDFLPIQALPFRDFADGFVPDWEQSVDRVLKIDWERMIPGHPGPGGRLGTKDDVRALREYMTELSAEVKKAADAGKCFDTAMNEITMPKYASWGGQAFLKGNIERYCEYWGRGF